MTLKRWIKNWKQIINDFFVSLGFIWLMVEMVEYFNSNLATNIHLRSHGVVFVLLSLFSSLKKNYPKSSFIQRMRNTDYWIEIRLGDAFENEGALVVPINNMFDVALGGNVKKAKSIQNKLIQAYYSGKEDHLKNDIGIKLDLNKTPYPMGTVVEVEQSEKKFYLLANTKVSQNNRAESVVDDFMSSLVGLWDALACDSGKDEAVTIPLINTQHGRDPNLTREVVIKQIIDTFIDASRHRCVCDKLIISVQPVDLKKGELDIESLGKYLDFQCQNYKEIKFEPKKIGNEISPSIIKSISS